MAKDAALLGAAGADRSQRQVAERFVPATVVPVELALVGFGADRDAAVDQGLRDLSAPLVERRLQLAATQLVGGSLQRVSGQVVSEQRLVARQRPTACRRLVVATRCGNALLGCDTPLGRDAVVGAGGLDLGARPNPELALLARGDSLNVCRSRWRSSYACTRAAAPGTWSGAASATGAAAVRRHAAAGSSNVLRQRLPGAVQALAVRAIHRQNQRVARVAPLMNVVEALGLSRVVDQGSALAGGRDASSSGSWTGPRLEAARGRAHRGRPSPYAAGRHPGRLRTAARSGWPRWHAERVPALPAELVVNQRAHARRTKRASHRIHVAAV